ncbi:MULTISPECIES: protein phosphatase CheZ [unclassified Pantoea]|uniref:protein phosphatase CheZ n=1 Tax=unclassified Pantoea TaxID=2630326 RepID=UPI0015D0820E|nr:MULTISPECIES: protein phosphatase CheZ [unclassified Pantoea]NYS30787.1 protein phosphatase CheZ [Pantoea sp. WMus005]
MSPSDIHSNHQEIGEITARAGYILRQLRDSLQQLGLDKTIADVAGSIPNARERLGYVITMTREAAEGVINSVEITQPLQSELAEKAEKLTQRWDATSGIPLDKHQTQALAADTAALLEEVPRITGMTQQQLHAIMMSQGFQDLTGQIVQAMMAVLNQAEQQLIQVIRDNTGSHSSAERNAPSKPASASETPASQDDVDDLLASLGM